MFLEHSVYTYKKIILSVILYFSDPRLFTLDPRLFTLDPRLATLDQKVDQKVDSKTVVTIIPRCYRREVTMPISTRYQRFPPCLREPTLNLL